MTIKVTIKVTKNRIKKAVYAYFWQRFKINKVTIRVTIKSHKNVVYKWMFWLLAIIGVTVKYNSWNGLYIQLIREQFDL